ncbi:MAG TPA: hypothetical protein VJT73_07525, partial [Polyangiaceae bacterium]|nr:hypothetical protein [Polyangiaceae bacterium]
MAFRFSLRLCCLLGIAALVFASVPALAASITLGPGVERIQPFRKSAQTKYWVSRADCLADDKFEFTTTASSDTLGATLEVWA